MSEYRVFRIDSATTIQTAVEAAGVMYTRGSGYYQVGSKKEQISATKKLVVLSRDGVVEDRTAEARALLGISGSGSVQLSADACGDYTVFVQSTSGNRQLKAGTRMLFERPLTAVLPAAVGVAPGAKRQPDAAADTDVDPKRSKAADTDPYLDAAEEDPDRTARPPLVVDWMDRVDAAVGSRFPKLLEGDRRIMAFIKQVGAHQVEEMFAKHAAGECQCIEATVADLTAQEWFGSDFYYEDNWHFDKGVLQGYEGCVRFPEFFPLDDLEFEEGVDYVRRAEYDCEDLFVVLRQCVCDTITSACCCNSSPKNVVASHHAGTTGVGPAPDVVAQVKGQTRTITTESVTAASYCSVTKRLFCLTRCIVVFDADR